MKEITKTVTVEKIIYVAEDGTEFDNRYDCQRYEAKLWEDSLIFYDNTFEKSNLEECTYICILSHEDYNALVKLCDFEGISSKGIEDKPGIYMYEERRDGWINISEAITRITAKEKEND